MDLDPDCLFCRIVKREIPADLVLERDDVLAFRDINPQASTHVLVIPKQHIPSLVAVEESHDRLLASLVGTVNEIARQQGVADGFRVVTNIGPAAGQSVGHLHLHVLGGRAFGWPPG
ncbi:MAG TPA: histidine triad nucleotide-binding protein [Actinomycetes bacterium]|jgi:histidine triad (HIT) family protein|nr:histidine triad nucleotide-binding protein [Actinomycetes bacterium]